MLTQKTLKKFISYDPATGVFIRLKVPGIGRHGGGKPTGAHDCQHGYLKIFVDGKNYLAHRLAWLYMTGEFPRKGVDHKNGIKSDNRWNNLREASFSENIQNMKNARADNSTGFLGVYKSNGRFRSAITTHGERVHLGYYDSAASAHAAYLDAKRKLHPFGTI